MVGVFRNSIVISVICHLIGAMQSALESVLPTSSCRIQRRACRRVTGTCDQWYCHRIPIRVRLDSMHPRARYAELVDCATLLDGNEIPRSVKRKRLALTECGTGAYTVTGIVGVSDTSVLRPKSEFHYARGVANMISWLVGLAIID